MQKTILNVQEIRRELSGHIIFESVDNIKGINVFGEYKETLRHLINC